MFALLGLKLHFMLRTVRRVAVLARKNFHVAMAIEKDMGQLVVGAETATETHWVASVDDAEGVWMHSIDKAALKLEEVEKAVVYEELKSDDVLQDMVDEVSHVQQLLERDRKVFESMERVDGKKYYQKIMDRFGDIITELNKMVEAANNAHKEEYNYALRQQEGRYNMIDMALNNLVGSVMKASNALWNMRGGIRTEKHDEKSLNKDLHHFAHYLEQMFKAQDMKEKQKLAYKLIKDEEVLIKGLLHFENVFTEVTKSFVYVIHATVAFYFQLKKDQDAVGRFIKMLRENEYPLENLTRMERELREAKGHEAEEAKAIADALRRAGRKGIALVRT